MSKKRKKPGGDPGLNRVVKILPSSPKRLSIICPFKLLATCWELMLFKYSLIPVSAESKGSVGVGKFWVWLIATIIKKITKTPRKNIFLIEVTLLQRMNTDCVLLIKIDEIYTENVTWEKVSSKYYLLVTKYECFTTFTNAL